MTAANVAREAARIYVFDRLPHHLVEGFASTLEETLVADVVLLPTALSYVVTHVSRAHVPEARLGVPYERVELETSDGLRLRGWYVPSRNGAAVIAFPGRSSAQSRGVVSPGGV